MADVAQLGIAVDSSQVGRATGELDRFSGAAKNAGAATDTFNQAGADSENRMRAMESAAKRLGIPVGDYASKIAATTKAMNDNVAASGSMVAGAAKTVTSYNAISLLFQGVSAAVSAYYALTADKGPTLEASLTEQSRLIDLVKNAYRDAADKAGTFYDSSKAVIMLQMQQNILAVQEKISDKSKEIAKDFALELSRSQIPAIGDPMNNFTGAGDVDRTRATDAAVRDFIASVKAGTPEVEKFRDAVAGIGNADRTEAGDANAILTRTQAVDELVQKLKMAQRAMRELQGSATPDDRRALGLSNHVSRGADPFGSAENSARKQIAAMQAEAQAVNATAGEHAKLRMEAILLDAAQRNGGTATAAQTARIKALGDEASEAATKLAKAKVDADISFGRRTAFLSQEDVQIAQQLRGIYGNDIPAALASSEAAAIRFNNSLQQLSQLGQEINRGFAVEFSQQIRNGASAFDALKTAGSNALGKIADKLAAMAADNLWNSAFGGSPGGGLLSILGLGGSGSTAVMSGTGLGAGTGGLSFPMFAGGTDFAPGGPAIVGEKGPELVNLTRGSQVIPNDKLGGSVTIQSGDTHITIQGNADEKTLMLMKQELAKRDAAFHGKVVESVQKAKTYRQLGR